MIDIIEKLEKEHTLTTDEYLRLIKGRNEYYTAVLKEKAGRARNEIYGNKVYIRGLIEISNICKNDCYYCGIRKSNSNCERYRLTKNEILEAVDEGYGLGFKTFVMQGGEDAYFNDDILCEIVKEIKENYPDCAVTLSLGERSYESYRRLKEAGTDRYLLRHETADRKHYNMLHPAGMSFDNRIRCLRELKELGFQTGCGFMVGSPYQSEQNIAEDLKFIEKLSPEMCGIGPFIPHNDTRFKDEKAGSSELTCYLLSIIRLIKPEILLPATTALGTVSEDGRINGLDAGANVLMPNLSPESVRKKYQLYDNKIYTGVESAQEIDALAELLKNKGYTISTEKGDMKYKDKERKNDRI